MPTFEHSPSDRMQLVGQGDLILPGVCVHCRSGNHENGYIDLDVFFDYEGKIYLCSTCLTQAGEIIGMLTPGEAEFIREMNEELVAKVGDLTSELDKANERLKAFDSLLAGAIASNPDVVPVLNQSTPEVIGTPDEVANDATEGEPEPEESVTSDGPSDVSEPTGSNGKPKRTISSGINL